MYQLKYQSDISLKKNQSQISITNISQISVKKYNFAPLQRSYVDESHLQKTSDKKIDIIAAIFLTILISLKKLLVGGGLFFFDTTLFFFCRSMTNCCK